MDTKLIFLVFCSTCLVTTNSIAQISSKDKQLWKEYAVCTCITKAMQRDSVSNLNDISASIYFDYLKYSPKAFTIVNKYAISLASRVKSTGYADYGSAKPYFFECFKLWNIAETEKVLRGIYRYKNK